MDKTNQKVVPTSELLKEMEELEILGGSGSDDVTVFGFGKCTVHVYSGNCVENCGGGGSGKGTKVEDEEVGNDNPKPSTTDKP